MVAPAAYPCARCGSPLRWAAESSTWACDACRIAYPVQGAPVPPAAAPLAAAPRTRRGLEPKQKILVVAGSVVGVTLLGITLVLLMGGGKRGGKATPEELFGAAIDRATAGDGDGLFALSGVQKYEGVMDCSEKGIGGRSPEALVREIKESQREELTRHLDRWKGLTITITSVEPKDDADVQRAGTEMGGCIAKVDVTTQRFRVKAKVKGKDGEEHETELRFRAAQVEGLWYLDDMPSAPAADGLGKLRAIKDRMCACKDSACAGSVQKELEDFGKDMADSGITASDDSAEESRIINELTECEVKAMSNANPY
jgi:hypothetical protein